MIEPLSWLVAAAALAATWLNIRRHVASFWIWSCTNFAWVAIDIHHGIHAQAALQAVYFALSIYGISKWSRRPERGETRDASHVEASR